MILYEGPSALDGSPIVVIATGYASRSDNAKTGAMVQTWILRADVDPITASRTGADAGVCGSCPHRGVADPTKASGWARDRSCYVNLAQAPLSVFNSYRRGIYAKADPEAFALAVAGKGLRLGSYGDPAAVPAWVFGPACKAAAYVNGYTHAWRAFPALATWCMASADTAEEAAEAHALGFRTFRVRPDVTAPAMPREVVCPASEEAGKRTLCADCRACGGTSAKARAHIVIAAHGSGRRAVFRNVHRTAV